MLRKKRAIIIVSYGTANIGALIRAIQKIEEMVRAAYPEDTVYRAFTGARVRSMLEAQGIHVPSVEEILSTCAAEGYKSVILQPTHMVNGEACEQLQTAAVGFDISFRELIVGAPLLDCVTDMEIVARFCMQTYGKGTDAVVMMAHGTDTASNQKYTALAAVAEKLGFHDLWIAVKDAAPSLDDILPKLKEKRYRTITLAPLLLTAGHHACKDMAGTGADSWKSHLEAEGFLVTTVVKGLGEYPEIREIYLKHLQNAMDS